MNIKRPLFGPRKRPNRLSGAVRRPPAGQPRAPRPAPELWTRYKKRLLPGVGGLLLLGGLVAWLVNRPPSAVPETKPAASGDTPSWRACLNQWPDGTLYPDLLPVPAGEYRLHANAQDLKPFLAPHGLHKIQIKEPFLIEKNEVTLKAFRHYVTALERLPAGADKDRLKSHLGLHWNKDESESAPVKGISWEAAWDYTDWLGQKTGCAYSLPTREQWGATVLLLDSARDSGSKAGVLTGEALKHLLWGVREWSSTPCAGGYYLLGEDDFVPLPEVRSATCMPAMLSVAGFRVVIKATAPNEPKAAKPAPASKKP
ncbi:MAG: SUMF1/EgtB/PvdO family nonheme iron enzyme [Magnetococcales bacterium]|nr:SUMF1/EgtB/PvdO family nonheme iron enzyme [Magnetococcales bacterium]